VFSCVFLCLCVHIRRPDREHQRTEIYLMLLPVSTEVRAVQKTSKYFDRFQFLSRSSLKNMERPKFYFLIWVSFPLVPFSYIHTSIYRVIRKSLRDFRTLRYSSGDGHTEGKHINRGRDNPRFCPTLRVLDTSTLGDAADVNPIIKFLQHTVYHVAQRHVQFIIKCWNPWTYAL
jgi:hypothetical protein